MNWYEIVLTVPIFILALYLYGKLRENNPNSNYNNSWKKRHRK